MDKKVMLAVAGSGKTTHIVDSLSLDKRSLIVTYTNTNYDNLFRKILDRFEGIWPDNITLMTYFTFLYRFCYKPFLSDICRAKGIIYDVNKNRYLKQNEKAYYLTNKGYFYSNRLSLFLERCGILGDIKDRIETYFDEFVVDEVQDIAGRDFSFLEQLMQTKTDMLFVGDFFQHTFDTSRDGNVNKNLYDDITQYIKRFEDKNVIPDLITLQNSWRCSQSVCEYVKSNIGIEIDSNRMDRTEIRFITDETEAERILGDSNIIKLHYQKSYQYGVGHRNWGDTKGEDCYQDVCVMLNKETMKKYKVGNLNKLAPATRNKLYVAITRAHGNVYFIEE